MNNEFAWRQQMRGLDAPIEPAHDLWPQIAMRIARVEAGPRRWPRIGLAIAAAVMIVCTVVWIVPHRQIPAEPLVQVAPHVPSAPAIAADTAASTRTALDWAVPANPVLAAAAQDLDSASADLAKALEERPDAVFLVGLLNRTNGQRMRLLREPYAG